MDNATAARKPLTSTTWADIPAGVASQRPTERYMGVDGKIAGERRLAWTEQSDLAYELAAATHLTEDQARTLVSMTASGMPFLLTWETHLQGGKIETTRTIVIIDHLSPSGGKRVNEMRVRHLGFSHDMMIKQIVDVEVFEAERTYRDPS